MSQLNWSAQLRYVLQTLICALALAAISACTGGGMLGSVQTQAVYPAESDAPAAGASDQNQEDIVGQDFAPDYVLDPIESPSPTPSVTEDPVVTPPTATPAPTVTPGETPTLSPSPTPVTPFVLKIELSPNPATVLPGKFLDFTLYEIYSDGSKKAVSNGVTWSSGNPEIASVSAGRANGLTEGTVEISASLDGRTANAILNVADIVASLEVTPGTAIVSLEAGKDSASFFAVAHYASGKTVNVTKLATWTSASPNIAVIIAAGNGRGVAVGSGTLKATFGGKTGSAVLRVLPGVLTQTAGVNFEDSNDGDYNDAVLCFEGKFNLYQTPGAGGLLEKYIKSTAAQVVQPDIENRSGCDSSMRIYIRRAADGSYTNPIVIDSTKNPPPRQSLQLQFNVDDELFVNFTAKGDCIANAGSLGHSHKNSPRVLVEAVCRTTGD